MKRTKFARRKFFYNFYALQFAVGPVLIIAILSEGKEKRFNVSMRSKVKGIDGTELFYPIGQGRTWKKRNLVFS
jgi:hypothetical protein